MTNEQQERHRRFDEIFWKGKDETAYWKYDKKNKIYKSFIDEEIALAIANREKEILEFIAKEERTENNPEGYDGIIDTYVIETEKIKNFISKNK